MITFSDWTITSCGPTIARQYDNLSRTLTVLGELPEGWTWTMLVSCGELFNIITLSPVEGGVGADLTEDMLSVSGYYTMQLRGTQGEAVRHTNLINVYIPQSLSGSAAWPTVPSEFTQIEARITAINDHPPKPGEDGNWMIYNPDAGEYEASDIPLPDSGGMGYEIGHGLKVTGNTLEVDTAEEVEQDNTLPITSAAVYTTVGNIEVLLGTI